MKPEDVFSSSITALIERYFDDLDGESCTALYAIILSQVEQPLLETALNRANGNQSKAAKMLGINRNTLRKKMKQYGMLS
jgi:Fis family transcriptional regulator